MDYQKAYESIALQEAEKVIQMYYMIVNGNLVELRREELMYPYVEEDSNVGGGKANNNQSKVEMGVINILEDEVLQLYERTIERVMNVLQYLDIKEIEIIEAYYSLDYYTRNRKRTVSEVEQMVEEDKDTCEKIRLKVLNQLNMRT